MSNDQSVAPGWYPAPHANNEQRYWDGSRWLEQQAPPVGQSTAESVPTAPSPYSSFTDIGSQAGDGPGVPAGTGKRNILALISLIVAGVGFIFACIPGALVVGWILLPIGFILAVVSLFLKGTGKVFGIIGLIVAVVGTIVGIIVFFAVVAAAVTDAVSDETSVVAEPSAQPSDGESTQEGGSSGEGTRESPLPLGTTVASDDWQVTINSVTFAATDAVIAENQFNEAPAAGNEFILVNATLTYVGSDPDGGLPAFVSIDYVTAAGATAQNTFPVAPGALDSLSTLYTGGSVSGNVAIEVPSEGADDGVLAVGPGILADTVFFAVK